LDFSLSEEQIYMCKTTTEFARKKLNKDIYIDDKNSNFPLKKWQMCAEYGIHGLPIPAEYGGQEQSMLNTALAIESLAYGCLDEGLVFSICAHILACAVPFVDFGSEYQKQKYLPGIVDGSIICGNAISETESGSDLTSLSTSITKNSAEYIINGTKIFVSNEPIANLYIVYAKHQDGMKMLDVSAVIVEKKFAGIKNGQTFEKMGLRTCQLGEIILENCKIPSGNILGREKMGMLVFNKSMLWERIIMSAYHVGAMRQQYEIALEYANTRKQFNKKIIQFDSVSEMLINMKLRFELSQLMLYKTCWKYDNNKLEKEEASMLKLYVSDSKVKNSLDAVQIFGAYGYIKESIVEKQLRDSLAAKIYSGTSEIQKKIISESLVK